MWAGLRRRYFAPWLLALGCATAHPTADLPSDTPAPASGEEGVKSDMPKQGDTDLGTAFDPEQPAAPKEAPRAIEARKPAPGVDEEAAARSTYDEQLRAAHAALESGKLDEARTAAQAAGQAAQALFPADQQRAAELLFKVEREANDGPAAAKAGWAWLNTCGPDRVDACRAKVLASLTSLTAKPGPPPGLKEKVRELQDADACLGKAEVARKTSGCLEQAHALYRRQKDKLMEARVVWAKAVAALQEAKKKEEAVALLDRAASECQELRCGSVRRKALVQRRMIALRDKDLDEAARDALLEVKLASAMLPRAQRTYARTMDAERICAQLDAKEGQGSCRKLEKKLNGEYSFRDFSAGKTLPGLGQDKVKEVNEHYACLLEECLAAQADRLRPPDSETYEVRWMVLNDGRVGEVHLRRKEDDESPLAECLRQQFAVWRYPKYQGEFQHVEQRFIVTARARR